MTEAMVETMHQRLACLERTARRWRLVGWSAVALLGLLVLLGASTRAGRTAVAEVFARELILVNRMQTPRASLTIDQEGGPGLLLLDQHGHVRVGLAVLAYVCGDLGYCAQCPDNQYCVAGQPRTASKPSVTPPKPSAPPAPMAKVRRAIDGDTLALSTGETVRLIGVDTPETKHPKKPVERFGKEAAAFTKRLVEGKEVRLEYDQQRTDTYGRTLAYVYLADGTFLNAEIIRQGYGFAYTRFPFQYLETFRRLEREAREARRGLWEP
jgi:micrococcal nuclease